MCIRDSSRTHARWRAGCQAKQQSLMLRYIACAMFGVWRGEALRWRGKGWGEVEEEERLGRREERWIRGRG
eukprot:1426609-Pleurochrysis_carterae.AAC.1